MPSFGREPFQADGGRKTRGAATDNNDAIFDAFPVPSEVHHYLSQLVGPSPVCAYASFWSAAEPIRLTTQDMSERLDLRTFRVYAAQSGSDSV